jgi:hypothetical protein
MKLVKIKKENLQEGDLIIPYVASVNDNYWNSNYGKVEVQGKSGDSYYFYVLRDIEIIDETT